MTRTSYTKSEWAAICDHLDSHGYELHWLRNDERARKKPMHYLTNAELKIVQHIHEALTRRTRKNSNYAASVSGATGTP